MSNVYTSAIEERDVTIQEFARSCARAFLAFGLVSDNAFGAPIRIREPDDHHAKGIEKATDDLKRAVTMTDEEAEQEAAEHYDTALRNYEQNKAKQDAILARYDRMLKDVQAWDAPETHSGLHNFMIEQIQASMRYIYVPKPPTRMSGAEYREVLVSCAQHSLRYHTHEQAQELEYLRAKREWVDALEQSLQNHVTKESVQVNRND